MKPDRYRHINQFVEAIEIEGEEGKDVIERINRKEAVLGEFLSGIF